MRITAQLIFSCALNWFLSMRNIAIFASGSGTNAENFARYFAQDDEARIALVLSNHSTAGVHDRMKSFNIPTVSFSNEDFSQGKAVLTLLKEYRIDFIVLAGFMSKISKPLLEAFPNKIVNIHPALLPKFGGKGMYGKHVHEAVIAAKEKETGITIHYINEHYDEGAIIFQAVCPVELEDDAESIAKKVHALEYKYYPEIVRSLLVH